MFESGDIDFVHKGNITFWVHTKFSRTGNKHKQKLNLMNSVAEPHRLGLTTNFQLELAHTRAKLLN